MSLQVIFDDMRSLRKKMIIKLKNYHTALLVTSVMNIIFPRT